MMGKDIKKGTVIGNKRVISISHCKGRWVYYTYEYRVADEHGVHWHRQLILPVDKIAVNKRVEE